MGATAGGAYAQDILRFVLVSHGAETDPFWATVKQGAEQAAADAGVELSYRAPAEFDLDAMTALANEAVAERPAGLIVSIPNADALAAPIRAAADARIPVISINSGFDVSASLGAMLHVGQSEYESGRVAGERMRELGGRKALCINHELGNVALDLRCKGFIDGFEGSVEVLPVEPDPQQVGAKMAKILSEDGELDVVLALSASIAGEPTIAAVQAMGSGRAVRIGSFDTTEAILTAVADRTAAFAIDQQPFLQGYLPVHYLALLHRHNVAPVSNISTGPKLVTAEEAALRLGRTPAPETTSGSPVPDDAASDPTLPVEPGGG
jgi:simple sugar transport system substrate-binding protein